MLAVAWIIFAHAAIGQRGAAIPPLTAAQIVARMATQNRVRSQKLTHYQSVRHYAVEYHGFPESVSAAMDVQIVYDAASGKHFRILSQRGSKLMCNKVLRRAIESEREASLHPRETALTSANYIFELEGSDLLDGRPTYRLRVRPARHYKFLYQGEVWVDAQDFAVVRIQAQPAQNPSFWIKQTQIDEHYEKVRDYWLPKYNRSITRVRFGGRAVLTIDYGVYQFGPAEGQ